MSFAEGTLSRDRDKEIGQSSLRPSGCGPNGPASLLLLADAQHRLVVAPRIRIRFARNK